jgi:hypothetical protein
VEGRKIIVDQRMKVVHCATLKILRRVIAHCIGMSTPSHLGGNKSDENGKEGEEEKNSIPVMTTSPKSRRDKESNKIA